MYGPEAPPHDFLVDSRGREEGRGGDLGDPVYLEVAKNKKKKT